MSDGAAGLQLAEPIAQEAIAPAEPLREMKPAPRPELTPAELAAKERADKLASKKQSKGKGKPAARKGGKQDAEPEGKDKRKRKSKSKPKAKPEAKRKRSSEPKAAARVTKPKRVRTGASRRLLMIALPVLVVLGGAAYFVYSNKERFGIGTPGEPELTSTENPGPGLPPAVPVPEIGGRSQGGDAASAVPHSPLNPNPIPGLEPGGGEDPAGRPMLDEPPQPIQLTEKEIQEIQRDPKRTLEAFLLSGTVDDLLNFVADREIVEADIRAHYPAGKRTPIASQSITFDSRGLIPDTNLAAYMYWVTSSRRQIPVSVEETAEGYKVDWSAFTQFHDAVLERFLRVPGSEGGGFYVQLRRSHYFGNDIADIDELHAFRVQSPIAPFPEAYVFLRKSNPKAKQILERYRWSTGYRPYVRLKWVTPAGEAPRIEMEEIIRHTWRR